MRVLILATDLYKTFGGGQTVYKKIIEATPEVHFSYFRENEPADAHRPKNAASIPLLARRNLKVLAPPPYPSYKQYPLEEADRVARSVTGQSFDIVDVPDFYTFGSALRDAFAHHHVKVGRIVLAMHGNISVSIEMNWGSAGNNVLEQRMLERAQFDAADGIYAISLRYMREWRAIIERDIHYIDPISFVSAELATPTLGLPEEKPSLYCIGRSERRKGNDLFIELVRWLRQDSFHHAAHIGDQDYSYKGIGSAFLLENIAKYRDIKIDHCPSFNRNQLNDLFAKRSVVVLPVRYDTLNLVALEALFSGCPVAVSSRAGVCDYLDETYPGLPYVKIEFDNFYSVVAELQNLIDNYDRHRQQLTDYLAGLASKPEQRLEMHSVYAAIRSAPPRHGELKRHTIPYEERGRSKKEQAINLARRLLPTRSYHALRQLARAPKHFLVEKIKASSYLGDAKFFGVLADAKSVPWRLKRIADHSEYNLLRLREKLDEIYGNASNPLYRCNFWLDIARIERILGNDLMAVTYELRILRLLGQDRLDLLPRVSETLRKHGCVHEARAAEAMYGDPDRAAEDVYAYLQEAYQRNLVRQDKLFEVLDDRRTGQPKVSVIVSLYKAAAKLNFFLTVLGQQTLVKQGAVEIILVDSGSPDKERDVIDAFMQKHPLNVVYARSAERETIQAAWNRGIGLARAPYLVFLGVDEMLYPEGLEVLANELDQNPNVDWVMANSLVTAVDETGVLKNDVMPYDRTGGTKDHTYLETCYLSWVGGMYRKSIHERYGYYDETFRAAGDTEFKNRVLPHINVRFVPRTLGLFLNYPDERTTASPVAEIEDSRAWYLHRTPGGVRYAFENRDPSHVLALFHAALGYRKSYCRHISSDVEYAGFLLEYARNAGLGSELAPVSEDLARLLTSFRKLEWTESNFSAFSPAWQLVRTWREARREQHAHARLLAGRASPTYRVLNDNRFEQHSWIWNTLS